MLERRQNFVLLVGVELEKRRVKPRARFRVQVADSLDIFLAQDSDSPGPSFGTTPFSVSKPEPSGFA